MKSSAVGVVDLVSLVSDMGAAKHLSRLPGVKHVDVESGTANATVTYDQAVTNLVTIRADVEEARGHHCAGEIALRHVCKPEDAFAVNPGSASGDREACRSSVARRARYARRHDGARDRPRAVGYNVIAFPLPAGVLYPFLIRPEVAALAMSASSALVALSAMPLKRTHLESAPPPAVQPSPRSLKTAKA